MLISEPKIPQPRRVAIKRDRQNGSDVDQRAENSSTPLVGRSVRGRRRRLMLISEPKIPQPRNTLTRTART